MNELALFPTAIFPALDYVPYFNMVMNYRFLHGDTLPLKLRPDLFLLALLILFINWICVVIVIITVST